MLDLHCHVLPGVDDGAASLDEALAMARFCVQDGITHVVATPQCHRRCRLLWANMRLDKDSGHGVGWRWINPGLPAWWEAQLFAAESARERGEPLKRSAAKPIARRHRKPTQALDARQ
jgi:hypothetical protein